MAPPAEEASPAETPTGLADKMAQRRQEIADSKEQSVNKGDSELYWSWRRDAQQAPRESCNFLEAMQELNVLPGEEPEYLEVEMTLDTGATVHAADRVDFPGCVVEESAGSRAGQNFQTAGGKLIPNEGQALINMIAPGGIELAMTMQIAKITRPLLSVTKMTEGGEISVLCKKDVALVLDGQNRTLATFHRKGGLYVCMMKYKNPRHQQPEGFVRPRE